MEVGPDLKWSEGGNSLDRLLRQRQFDRLRSQGDHGRLLDATSAIVPGPPSHLSFDREGEARAATEPTRTAIGQLQDAINRERARLAALQHLEIGHRAGQALSMPRRDESSVDTSGMGNPLARRLTDEPSSLTAADAAANPLRAARMIQDLKQRNEELLLLANHQSRMLKDYESLCRRYEANRGHPLESSAALQPTSPAVAADLTPPRSKRTSDDGSTKSGTDECTSFTMAAPKDPVCLNKYHVLVRQSLEFFEAGKVESHTTVQGRKKQIHEEQVGIRCAFCKHVPIKFRRKGAVYYPNAMRNVYQDANSIARSHLIDNCPCVPDHIEASLRNLKALQEESLVGKKYWIKTCMDKGIYEQRSALWLSKAKADSSA